MFLEVIITIGVALVIAAAVGSVGTPIAVRIARPRIWERGTLPMNHTGPAPAPPPSFEPLDLGPDPVHWPSERPWKSKGLVELPWPSQTWNDPHFGAHWRTHSSDNAADQAYERNQAARRQAVAQAREADSDQRGERQQRDRASEAQQRAKAEIEQLRQRASQATQQAQAALGNPREAAQAAREAAEQAARKAAAQAKQAAQAQAKQTLERHVPGASDALSKVPSPAELEQLVAQVGLAGTVQKIMERTGWDFKTAAQHLARARRGR